MRSKMKIRNSGFILFFILFFILGGCRESKPNIYIKKQATPILKEEIIKNFSHLQERMTEIKVRELLGNPDGTKEYRTGKQWIPFYYGPDTQRVEYLYFGIGTVIFTRNRYSGRLSVVKWLLESESAK